MHRLLLLSVMLSLALQAQERGETDLDPERLDYYLQAALNADKIGARPALNHIGIQVIEGNKGYLVSAVLEGYPAHVAGINRGDIIQAANDEPFHPVFSFNGRGSAPDGFSPASGEYRLHILRGDAELDLTVRPVFENLYDSYRSATLNSIQQFSAGNKIIGYLRPWILSRASNDLVAWRNMLAELAQCDGIILDLRNSTGFLDMAHLDAVYQDRGNYFRANGAPDWLARLGREIPIGVFDPYQKPVAVLINGATRGGAELLAYQLDKLQRVVTLGEATPGRVGEYLSAGGSGRDALHYQPALELSIDGREFEGRGISPEVPVPYPFEQTTRSDPQYQAAVNTLLGTI